MFAAKEGKAFHGAPSSIKSMHSLWLRSLNEEMEVRVAKKGQHDMNMRKHVPIINSQEDKLQRTHC